VLRIVCGYGVATAANITAAYRTGIFELRGLFLETSVNVDGRLVDERLESALVGGIRWLAEAHGFSADEVVGIVPEGMRGFT